MEEMAREHLTPRRWHGELEVAGKTFFFSMEELELKELLHFERSVEKLDQVEKDAYLGAQAQLPPLNEDELLDRALCARDKAKAHILMGCLKFTSNADRPNSEEWIKIAPSLKTFLLDKQQHLNRVSEILGESVGLLQWLAQQAATSSTTESSAPEAALSTEPSGSSPSVTTSPALIQA